MAISDLTGTTWVINSTTCTAGYGQFSITGTYSRGGTTYDIGAVGLYIGYSIGARFTIIETANSIVTMPSGFDVQVGDVVKFTGGTDATPSGSGFASLVSWLEANATQQSTVSLANTKWRFKDNPDLSSFSAAGTSYSIAFVSNATNYTLLKLASTSIAYNTTTVYTGTTPLTAPSIALSSDIVTITDNDGNATGFKVYWNDSTDVAETITKTS